MHTTGTTTPDGVHQLAPGLGERRFMPPPSGGQFKLPGEQAQAQALQQTAQAVAVPPQMVHPSIDLPAPGRPLGYQGAPPAPAGYQSAPTHVPPGMVPHTVQHAAPQGLSGMQPQGFMAVNTPGGFQPAPPTTTTNTTSWPRPLGSMEVAPPTHTHPAPSAPWPPAQPHPLTPIPSTYPADVMPSVPQPHAHQRATLTPGTVVRLEGPQDVIEAAIGMLMLRGLHVTVLPS